MSINIFDLPKSIESLLKPVLSDRNHDACLLLTPIALFFILIIGWPVVRIRNNNEGIVHLLYGR